MYVYTPIPLATDVEGIVLLSDVYCNKPVQKRNRELCTDTAAVYSLIESSTRYTRHKRY